MTVPPKPEPTSQARLRGMKRLATALLACMGVLFIAARWLETRYPWVGLLRATCEAAVVGALADWFAVVALFRHPLGLPIPHTAIIARRKEALGRQLGKFVQTHFFAPKIILRRLRQLEPGRAAWRWLARPEAGQELTRHLMPVLAESLRNLKDQSAANWMQNRLPELLRPVPLAPVAGSCVQQALEHGWHHRLFEIALNWGAEALHQNEFAVRRTVIAKAPWFLPASAKEGVADQVLAKLHLLIQELRSNRRHPARRKLEAALWHYREQLRDSPEWGQKVDAGIDRFLAGTAGQAALLELWHQIQKAGVEEATRADSSLRRALEEGWPTWTNHLANNPRVLEQTDRLIRRATLQLLRTYRGEIGRLIAQTIALWDTEQAVERFELQVGRDLQYIRINGTVIGGMVGLLIYCLEHLWLHF